MHRADVLDLRYHKSIPHQCRTRRRRLPTTPHCSMHSRSPPSSRMEVQKTSDGDVRILSTVHMGCDGSIPVPIASIVSEVTRSLVLIFCFVMALWYPLSSPTVYCILILHIDSDIIHIALQCYTLFYILGAVFISTNLALCSLAYTLTYICLLSRCLLQSSLLFAHWASLGMSQTVSVSNLNFVD